MNGQRQPTRDCSKDREHVVQKEHYYYLKVAVSQGGRLSANALYQCAVKVEQRCRSGSSAPPVGKWRRSPYHVAALTPHPSCVGGSRSLDSCHASSLAGSTQHVRYGIMIRRTDDRDRRPGPTTGTDDRRGTDAPGPDAAETLGAAPRRPHRRSRARRRGVPTSTRYRTARGMSRLAGGLLLLSVAALCDGKVEYSLGAFYYGPWHRDPTNEKLHGTRWARAPRLAGAIAMIICVAA
eukprot:COSAG02_NODE_1135_length_14342_cov_6.114091_6_plen_237_part_00